MQLTTKTALGVVAGAMVGNYAAERFVLKQNAEDKTGFIMVAEGWGADDLVRGLFVLAGVFLVSKVLGKVGG